jgi:hypothetical protein
MATLGVTFVIMTEHSHLEASGSAASLRGPAREENEVLKSENQASSKTIPSSGNKLKIAYAITVTKDGPFVDGATVLGYSARRIHSAKHGFPSKYDVELVAFVVPKVVTSRPILEKHGWRVIERGLPVPLEEIENKEYVTRMRNSGCCGADEFLKLWAYSLTEYYRVIHLDMDSIIYQNMDELYDMDYDMLHTPDYNMGSRPVPPAQGGFLVIRPSMDTFMEFQKIIRIGDYRSGSGWGGSHIGKFWGGQTIQGIVPYFYSKIKPGMSKLLNRCEYNCMVDNPYRKNTLKCLDGQPSCQDCRAQVIEKVKSAHFTICQKPWTCTMHSNPRNSRLCLQLHEKWFMLRDEYETLLGVDKSYRGDVEKSRFKESHGMCRGYGDNKYIPMPKMPGDGPLV